VRLTLARPFEGSPGQEVWCARLSLPSAAAKVMVDLFVKAGQPVPPAMQAIANGTVGALKPVPERLKKIAAQVDDGPCVTHIGTGSAGSKIYRSSERGCSSHNLRSRISELIH
jgi:hypothetical protein